MVKPSHSVFDSEIKYLVVTVQIKVIEQYFLVGNSVEGDRGVQNRQNRGWEVYGR